MATCCAASASSPTARAHTRSSCAPAATGCASSTGSTSSPASAARKSVCSGTSPGPAPDGRVAGIASDAGDGVESPLPRDTPQLVDATVFEGDARAGDQIVDGLRYEDLAGAGLRRHSGAGCDRDPRDLSVEQFAFPRVQSCAQFEIEGLD